LAFTQAILAVPSELFLRCLRDERAQAFYYAATDAARGKIDRWCVAGIGIKPLVARQSILAQKSKQRRYAVSLLALARNDFCPAKTRIQQRFSTAF
jgi:hypothetical protein